MAKRLLGYVIMMLCLAVGLPASAAFKDIKIDLMNGNFLDDTEKVENNPVSFGIAIAEDGTQKRVAADDATADIVLSGKWHSDQHGWANFSATLAVNGPVKIGMGSCNWGGDVTVKNAAGETVATFNTSTGACFDGDATKNVVYGVYKGSEATTLTISGGKYTPYLSVVEATADDLKTDYEVSYSLGDVTGVQGTTVPETIKVEDGKTFVVPANFTLYKEGHTLTGWTDGTNIYKVGEEVAPKAALALTPVFTANTVTLADRDAEVTLNFDFQRKNGAPTVGFQNQVGVWVAQATVKGQLIDVKADFDTNNGGKFANGNWTDWAQLNGGTKFTVPSCKDAVVSIEAYSEMTTTSIDGQTDYTSGKVVSYTIANTAETIDVVIGDGSYFRYIKVVMPVAQQSGGKTYTNEPASVIWNFNTADTYETANTILPADGFTTTAFNLGNATVTGVGTGQATNPEGNKVTFVKIKPANGASDYVDWVVKPAAGLIFTPTKVSGYIARFGTDSQSGVTISAVLEDGTTEQLGTYTAPRNNKSQADDKFGSSSDYANQFVIELTADQQAKLATAGNFTLRGTVGVGNTKEGGYSDVRIEGVLNGTTIDVAKYTLTAKADPAEAAEITLYPKADEYEEGSEVKVTAAKNFGYKFVNWTDAEGNVVSEEPVFTYTVKANAELTANFTALKTYELAVAVDGGANDYMVTLTPAPTIIDGKNMYEEGTKVTMSAASNPILTFASWSNGETTSEMAVDMNENKSFVASYAAVDYIVGWDFILKGGSGRAADFYAADNDAVSLILRNEAGEQSGWLDKSQEAANGYEGRPAAVNWRTGASNGDVGYYYWETNFNASAFTDLKIITSMLYNYNAYQRQNVEYSLDGETWKPLGDINIPGVKNWTDAEFNFPTECDNQPKVYVRWKSDKTSNVDGTASANDGITLGASYIVGTAKLVDDGKAPALVSSVPANNGTGASANGKIVLTFDEKIKLTDKAKATLDGVELTPAVSGKTIICEYKGLSYSQNYSFVLAGGSVSDLTDNVYAEDITIAFQTKVRPVVEKAVYDFVVGVDGTLAEAFVKANEQGKNNTKRYRILILEGDYKLPAGTADKTVTIEQADGSTTQKTYKDPTTYLTGSNISFIGVGMDKVTITNSVPTETITNKWGTANIAEGIGNGDVLSNTGTLNYFQGLTMKSSMGDARGRDIVLNDKGNKTVFKDACLWGYQDTYVSNNESGRFYFEGGVLRGRTDYLCGKGDVFYKDVTLQQCGEGGYLAVPSKKKNYGYVFDGCYIKKETDNVTFYLGRPWGSGTPQALFMNTKMDANALGNGWADMSGGWPARFAEYNSYLVSGTTIDLSGRRTSWKDNNGVEHPNDPILTIDEVKQLTIANVMGQDDDWDPTELTEQASAPANVKIEGTTLSWNDNNYVLCWVVFKDGKYVAAVTEPTYTVDDAKATWTVCAANEMGGLSEAAKASIADGIDSVATAGNVVSVDYYTVNGVKVGKTFKGMLIEVKTLDNGEKVTTKVIR